tara:strand:+ start:1878 stop:3116 length:1239 start_codon:yes stop_codon:yes gene_type:complete
MLKGKIKLKGDKSISHRIVIFGALSTGSCVIKNLSTCDDVQKTINILKGCNINIENKNNESTIIKGGKFSNHITEFDCGNSGSTARFMLGLLPSRGINGILYGDQSLSSRPMGRVIEPLNQMNINIKNSENKLPLIFKKSNVKSINYTLQIPSAQVKTALIFAALSCDNKSYINDPFNTRDHTERIIQYLGHKKTAFCKFNITPFNFTVPGDISSASFIISAAILIPKSNIIIENLLYNDTRIGYIKVLKKMGANIEVYNKRNICNEPVVDMKIKYTNNLIGIKLDKALVISMIDEIPIFALVASFAKGTTAVKGAKELRYKESDRIKSIVNNLKICNGDITETDDGFIIRESKILYNTSIDIENDHRIAMTFEILNLIKNNIIHKKSDELSIIKTSFPEFYDILRGLNEKI